VIGTLVNGAVFTIQIEGGKRNNSGLQIDITGMEGDLKVSNSLSFGNAEDNKIEGVKGDGEPLRLLPIPRVTTICPLPLSMPASSIWPTFTPPTRATARTELALPQLVLTP
jgi:hypothetical protein